MEEPDSAGSREESGSLREQSLQAGGGEHGASWPDAPGTLGVMRDELTVYFPGATSLKSTIYHVTNWMAPNLVSSQSGDLKEGQEVPGPEPLSIPKAEWGRTPSRGSFAPESENTAVTGAPGPKQLLPERPRAGWCPSFREGHLPATHGLFLDRRREPPSRSLREPPISGTKPVQGKTGEKPDSSPPSRESVNDRRGCRGRWRGGGAGGMREGRGPAVTVLRIRGPLALVQRLGGPTRPAMPLLRGDPVSQARRTVGRPGTVLCSRWL